MIEFGATLKRAREAKGMSVTELAQATNIIIQQIEALEREDFSKIPAPIYGRGFVKRYCEAVGIDPLPMINEFNEIYSGNREPTIRRREPQAAPQPVSSVLPPIDDMPLPSIASVATEENLPPAANPGDFALESEVVHAAEPAKADVVEPPVDVPVNDEFQFNGESPAPVRLHGPSRFSAPSPIDDDEGAGFTLPQIPRAVWRILALVVAAGVLLWLVFAGFRAVYRQATMTSPRTPVANTEGSVPPATTQTAAPETSKPEAAPAKPAADRERSLRTIPELYID